MFFLMETGLRERIKLFTSMICHGKEESLECMLLQIYDCPFTLKLFRIFLFLLRLC